MIHVHVLSMEIHLCCLKTVKPEHVHVHVPSYRPLKYIHVEHAVSILTCFCQSLSTTFFFHIAKCQLKNYLYENLLLYIANKFSGTFLLYHKKIVQQLLELYSCYQASLHACLVDNVKIISFANCMKKKYLDFKVEKPYNFK